MEERSAYPSRIPTDTGAFELKLITDVTLQAIQAENIHSQVKHGDKAMISSDLTNLERLPILMEEVGEVATALTYDARQNGKDKLVKELLQVSAMAACWAQAIDGGVDGDRGFPPL